MEKAVFRPKEAATYLGIGRSSLYEHIKSGAIKAFKLGEKTTGIKREELDRFLSERAGEA